MSELDVARLADPLSSESPCGDDLEYDPEFGALDREAQGKPEVVMGDHRVAAQPPDWRAVLQQAEGLLGRTKDLRVAVHLTRASLNRGGLKGLASGLELIRAILERHWDFVHPQIDPDDNDPAFRVNSVRPLADRNGLLLDLLRVPIVSSRAVGRFSLRDVRVANGELQPLPDQEQVPDGALIGAAFQDCDLDELEADAAAVDSALAEVGAIESIFASKVGVTESPNLDSLAAELKSLKAVLADQLRARGVAVVVAGEAAPGSGGAPPVQVAGEINSREDVVRMIDKICAYYERSEPSSPVPMLLQRAKRLVAKDFLEIMRDLTPDGVAQAELLGGIKHE